MYAGGPAATQVATGAAYDAGLYMEGSTRILPRVLLQLKPCRILQQQFALPSVNSMSKQTALPTGTYDLRRRYLHKDPKETQLVKGSRVQLVSAF